MLLKVKSIFALVLLLGIIINESEAGTFKPFIRSRYSIRWRQTTETPKMWDSTTASTLKEEMEKNTNKPKEVSEVLTDNAMQLTSIKTLTKTSTHPSDYDYYNNEVEEAEHKN